MPMTHKLIVSSLLAAAALCTAPGARAADEKDKDNKPANEQVIVPQVDRRNVRVPKFPSNDFELGLFTGTYATESFGSSSVSGVRLGYHITEDFFVEGAYARTKVSDENYRQILPGGIFPSGSEPLTYYNVSIGWNALPGEIFIWRNTAKASALYLMVGIGNTKFLEQRKQTINYGVGSRVFFADWFALQIDVRDHMFTYDLLGRRKSTHNVEFTLGTTFFF
jgi:outer membrane beta-barrel protein